MTTMTTPSALDYTNVDEICGWQLLLCKLYERAGGFDYDHRRTARIVALRNQARIWLRHVRHAIDSGLNYTGENSKNEKNVENDENVDNADNSIPRLLASYDLMYRLCNGAPCFDYLRDIRLKLADRWVKGDRSIPETDMVLELLKEVDRDNLTLDRRYSAYALSVKEKWIRQFCQCPPINQFPINRSTNPQSTNQPVPNQPISYRETYLRLAYLLKEDLFIFLGRQEQNRYKNNWIATYSLSDEETDGLDTPALRSYIAVARSAAYCQRLPLDDIDALYLRLLTKLSLRPDLHPYCRAALELEFDKFPVYAG